MKQQRLFNYSYYDEKRNAYVIESGDQTYTIFANEDGTVKKTKGLKHFRNKYETTSAKAMAQMVVSDMNKSYVEPDNLLPKIYVAEKQYVQMGYFINKKDVQHWELFVKNKIRLGFTVRSTAKKDTYLCKYVGTLENDSRYESARTFALMVI